MSDSNHLERRYPGLAARFGRECLANLPTPLQQRSLDLGDKSTAILVKRDDLTGELYGGNKLRKLEYALRPARDRKRRLIATFGAVGSNHALATSIYARHLGYPCTCLLVHQPATEKVRQTLLAHLAIGTSLARFARKSRTRNAIESQIRIAKKCNPFAWPAGLPKTSPCGYGQNAYQERAD